MAILGESAKQLSSLRGAHDSGDWNTVVEQVDPASPPFMRGAILCKAAGQGFVSFAGDPADAYGVCLDEKVDPTIPDSTVSVARNGTYDATQLISPAGFTVRDFEARLKEINILLEKVPLVV